MKYKTLKGITAVVVTMAIMTSLALTGLGLWLAVELIKMLGGM